MSVVLAVVVAAATLVGVLGSTPGSAFVRISDGSAWLWSTAKGWVTHVNGPSGEPDFNVPVPGSQGHRVELSQDGVSVLVSDLDTGVVSRIDPAGMGLLSRPFGPGGFRVVARGETAYVIDSATGTVTRVDPRTLDVIGAPVAVGAAVSGAGIDAGNVLWVAVPEQGELVAVGDGRVATRVRVAEPGARLTITIAGGQPVAVDASTPAVVPVSTAGPGRPTTLPSPPAGGERSLLVAPTVEGRVIPILVAGTSELLLADLGDSSRAGTVRRVTLTSQDPSANLGAPVINAGRVYVPDNGSGRVLVYDQDHNRFDQPIAMTGGPGILTVFVRNGSVWINNADGSDAVAVSPDGRMRRIDKYTPDTPVPAQNVNLRVPPPPEIVPSAPNVIVPRTPSTGTRDQPAIPIPPPPAPPPGGLPQPGTTIPRPVPTTPPPTTQPPPLPPPTTPPPVQAPGVPSVSAAPAAGAITVTVTAPTNGGPVTSYTLTTNPGGTTTTLTAPGTVTIPITGCTQTTTTATATGPGGTSPTSTPTQALSCTPPGPIRNLRVETAGVDVIYQTLVWDPPADLGGEPVEYLVVIYDGLTGDQTKRQTDTRVGLGGSGGQLQYSSITITPQNSAGPGPTATHTSCC